MLQSYDHHVKDDVCLTRPPYRNGNKLRAVKVYTIAQESKYLLVQNIPAIAGVTDQLLPHFNRYGTVEQHWKLDGYIRKDPVEDEQFFDTVLIKFVQIAQARLAKRRLDDMNFMGNHLHICYAPECESLDDLREKVQERRTVMQRRSERHRYQKGRKQGRTELPLIPKSDPTPPTSKSFERTTNEIRMKMRDIMKIFLIFLFLLISSIELRRPTNDDLYELDDLLKEKYEQYQHRPNKQYFLDREDGEDDDDRYVRPSSYPSRKKVLDKPDDSADDALENDLIPKTVDQDNLSRPSTCLNKYDVKSEQLVRVKELKNGARMIKYMLIDKRTLSPNLNVKDSCMLDCCAEKNCDLAMLSEQPTYDGFKCYLFACNGSCTLASHQDYTVMMSKKQAAVFNQARVDVKITSTAVNVRTAPARSYFGTTSVILSLVFGVMCTIVLFVCLYLYWRQSVKRGRRLKNYTVDEDYLINGLYL